MIDSILLRFAIIFNLFLIVSAALLAENVNVWRRTLGYNEVVQSIVVDPHQSGSLYCCSYADVFHTTDDGETWFSCGLGTERGYPKSLAIDPVAQGVVYVGTVDGKILKSRDAGESWTEMSVGLGSGSWEDGGIVQIEILPTDNQTILAVSPRNGLYKSTNAGQIWRLIRAGSLSSLAIDPKNPAILIVGGEQGILLKSTDCGATWRDAAEGMPRDKVLDFAIDPSDSESIFAATQGGGLYQTTNGGGSWSLNKFPGAWILSVVIHPLEPHNMFLVYSTVAQLVYRSVDHGKNWVRLNTGYPGRLLALDPLRPHHVYLGLMDRSPRLEAGLSLSTNDGDSWTRLASRGLPDDWISGLALDPSSKGVLYAATYSGIYKSLDGGRTWRANSGDLPASPVDGIAVAKSNPSVIYAYESNSGMYRSQNGGVNWVLRDSGLGDQPVRTFAIDPTNPDIVWASDGLLYYTHDGGVTWAEKPISYSMSIIDGILIDPESPNRVYVWDDYGYMVKSQDQGETWEDFSWQGHLTMDPHDHLTLYSGNYTSISKSTDGGEEWSGLLSFPWDVEGQLSFLQSDPRDSGTMWGILGKEIVRTTSGWKSWHWSSDGLISDAPKTILPDPVEAGVAYTYQDNSGIYWIKYSNPLDLNLDDNIDALDAVVLAEQLCENQYFLLPPSGLDVNGDGVENIADLVWLEGVLVGNISNSWEGARDQ